MRQEDFLMKNISNKLKLDFIYNNKRIVPSVSIGLLIITLLIFIFSRRDAITYFTNQFNDDAAVRTIIIKNNFDKQLLAISSMRNFYMASVYITESEFKSFVISFLEDDPGICTIEWIPIASADSKTFYRQAVEILKSDNKKVKLSHSYHIESDTNKCKVIDVNSSDDSILYSAIEKAVKSNKPVISYPIEVETEKDKSSGYRILQSVERGSFTGLISGLYRFDKLVYSALSQTIPIGLPAEIIDITDPGLIKPIYIWNPRKNKSDTNLPDFLYPTIKLNYEKKFNYGDKHWLIKITPSETYIKDNLLIYYWLILPFGILVTLLITSLLNNAYRSRNKSERIAVKSLAELHASEDRYRSIVDNSFIGIFTMDSTFKIIYVNDKICDISGYSREELTGTDLRNYIAKENLDSAFEKFVSRQKGILFDPWSDVIIIRKDGKRKYIQVRTQEIITAEGAKISLGQIIDVTERREAEIQKDEAIKALLVSEQKYRDIFNNSIEGIFHTTLDGRLTSVNATLAKLSGYSSPEEMMKKLKDIGSQAYAFPGDREKMLDHLMKHNYLEGFETELYIRNKEKIWASCNLQLKRDKDGKPLYIEGTLVDITARKKIEAEKKQLEEMFFHAQKIETIGRLAGGIAHDFNNLLTAILGNTEMIMETLKSDEKTYSRLAVVKKAAEGAANLTRQLLTFSRKQLIEPKIINLNDLINHIRKMIFTLIGEKITLKFNPYNDLQMINADAGQIEQIIMNIASNARDSMPEGGTLTIETSNVFLDKNYCQTHINVESGDYVMLAISDTGFGMSREIMDHLFEPFFTTKAIGKGTGLGLSTVYGIIKQNKGTIEVYSEVDHGTTFKIYFPAVLFDHDKLPATDSDKNMPSGHETILIVEDNAYVLEFICDILTHLGYRVISASDGEEAIKISQMFKEKIHLLLTDIILPGKNGKITYESILKERPGLKVLYSSGYTAGVIDKKGIITENMNFIGKPYNVHVLAARVRDVLDNK